MRFRTALKVRVGDFIHMKPEVGARKYTVSKIEYGPLESTRVRYPLFKTTNNGSFTYLLVRIAQKQNGEVIV